MKYEIYVSRAVTDLLSATVYVEAETEAEAIAKAELLYWDDKVDLEYDHQIDAEPTEFLNTTGLNTTKAA